MSVSSLDIEYALEVLGLPHFIQKKDIQHQYYFLAKKNHPDLGGKTDRMEELNRAYAILNTYIENFRYTFDKEEIFKQFPGAHDVR